MKKAIGGQRLGSGNKMNTELHNYGRSTHNLTQRFISSMACGTLIPFYTNVALNGDTWDIDLNAAVRTIPTKGPLFGSFKLQLDIFQVPMRLYHGILHNNPINVGMHMEKVKMPKIIIAHREVSDENMEKAKNNPNYTNSLIATNALIRYLGLTGIGTADRMQQGPYTLKRAINAMPVLAYYDIFKNYYANKQETNAYVISATSAENPIYFESITMHDANGQRIYYNQPTDEATELDFTDIKVAPYTKIAITANGGLNEEVKIYTKAFGQVRTIKALRESGIIDQVYNTPDGKVLGFRMLSNTWLGEGGKFEEQDPAQKVEIGLQPFPLENIDQMRKDVLTWQTLGTSFRISESEHAYLPYSAVAGVMQDWRSKNALPQNGLVVKTYQSDLYNNWVNTEWIDGPNGINEITAVSTQGNKFSIDALNLAKKVYNMLNRIAVSGGTWEDWQEAVYGEEAIRHAESPIYHGGMSSEIVFEEVVTTSDSEVQGERNYTGSLSGKGTLVGRKGGHVTIKVKEPSIIMGIVSITPRIVYTQGNEWYLTELDSFADLHKPELDGIGFQELMTEQMAWWTTRLQPNSEVVVSRTSAGKVPAWINYMTAVDKAFGDFADFNAAEYMVLSRDYQPNDAGVAIKDITTYIDPQKYNYAFAYTALDAQNFWVQIESKIEARRKMSAKIIPNL